MAIKSEAIEADATPVDDAPIPASKAREYAVIRFPKSSRKTDPPIVSVGVNGEKIRCKRNELVPVKACFLDALRNAKEPVVEEEDGGGGALMIRRRKIVDFAPRYPFELMGWIDEKTYEEFRKLTTSGVSLTEDQVYARI